MTAPVRENLTLPDLGRIVRWGMINRRAEAREARDWIDRVAIRPAHPEATDGSAQRRQSAEGDSRPSGCGSLPTSCARQTPTQVVDVAARARSIN